MMGRLRAWFGVPEWTNVLALVDQAVYSGTNFLTTVLLGRLCGADELGAYSLAFALLALTAAAQEALVSTPYMIYAQRRRRAALRCYAGSTLVQHAAIAAGALVVFALGASVFAAGLGPRNLAPMVAALAAVVPFVLLREFIRKIAFAHLDMGAATAMDVAIAVLQFTGLAGLAAAGRLSAVTGLAVVGLAWGAGGAIWLARWRDRFLVRAKRVPLAARRNWRLGRWVFASVTTFMLQSSLILWMLALLLGTAASGLFAACINVVALSNPFVNALVNVLTPRGARAFWQGGGAAVRRVVFRAARVAGALTGVFALVLCVAGEEVLQLLFGHKFFGTDNGDQRMIIALLGIWGLARALGMMAYVGLFVVQRPSVNLWINLATLVPLPFLLPIVTAAWGVPGAAAALLGLELVALAARWAAFLAATRHTAVFPGVRQSPTQAGQGGQKALPAISTCSDGTLP